MTTDLPARMNSSAMCVPIYPAPPVSSHVSEDVEFMCLDNLCDPVNKRHLSIFYYLVVG